MKSGRSYIHCFPKVYPKYSQIYNPLLDYSSARLDGIPFYLIPSWISTHWAKLPHHWRNLLLCLMHIHF